MLNQRCLHVLLAHSLHVPTVEVKAKRLDARGIIKPAVRSLPEVRI
jgi:hypothetical protein